MEKKIGTPKPLARSYAISGTEGIEDEQAMEIYTKKANGVQLSESEKP